jgi:hypothetical protein
MIMIGKSLTLSRFGNYMLKFFFSDFFVPFFLVNIIDASCVWYKICFIWNSGFKVKNFSTDLYRY